MTAGPPGGGRAVVGVPVGGADGTVLLGPLREALSGAGPVLAPHAADRAPDPAAVAPLAPGEDADDDPLAAVVSTTGSTGRAKHVLLPASALLASAAATHDALGGAGTWLLAVPARTVAGVLVVVRSLVAGTRPGALDLTGGFDPAAFARAALDLAARAPGRRYTSLVPAQLDLLLEPAGPADHVLDALRSLDAVLVGGAALSPALRARAEESGVRVVATYGMTETCGGCVYDGVPLPGVQVRLDPLGTAGGAAPGGAAGDAAGHAGPDVGRVVLSGPVVARGYRFPAGDGPAGDGPASEGPASEGFGRRDGVREFRTADRGALVGGLLRLAGRTDDVVVSGGANISLDAVDRVVREVPGVRDCLVVALPSERWGAEVAVLVVDAAGATADDDRVRAAVRDALGSAAVPRRLRHVRALPLAGVGKPDRVVAAALLGAVDAATPGLGDHGGRTTPTEETT